LMRMMNTLQNMMIQESQQWMESRLIEVMNVEMQMIQFVLIVNWIQMWLMKVMNTSKNMMIQESQHWMESRYLTMSTDYK
jgi:hypothetical protein